MRWLDPTRRGDRRAGCRQVAPVLRVQGRRAKWLPSVLGHDLEIALEQVDDRQIGRAFFEAGSPWRDGAGDRFDIDNRLLTLFDALALPNRDDNYSINDRALSRTDPIFCLLGDDELITALNIRTDRLLVPAEGAHPKDVRLIIGVTVKASLTTAANIGLVD